MRDFSKAVTAIQAPVWVCDVIGGSDTEPTAAQIAAMNWYKTTQWKRSTKPDAALIAGMNRGNLGYIPLNDWRSAEARAFSDVYRGSLYEPARFHSDKISAAYGAWYLAYQRIPQDNIQSTRRGTGLYAMQGFRCAIRMSDFPAARQYWTLALSTNPESKAKYVYAQFALQSFFQSLFLSIPKHVDSGVDYLAIPQDIRSAVWDAAKQSYSGSGGKLLSMKQVEDAAQQVRLSEIISRRVPTLSTLYCPAFYPDFDPISGERTIQHLRSFSIPVNLLEDTAKRSAKKAEGGEEK
jgi:hypothetical protein